MGKDNGGDLWDDSALISAFDDALSKYKKMHGMKTHRNQSEGGEVIPGCDKSVSNTTKENPTDASVVASGAVEGAGETSNLLSANEETSAVKSAQELHPSSSVMPMNDVVNGDSYSQGTEEYNKLLMEYYELEETRGKLLQKLHQCGNWNYQTEPSGADPSLQQYHVADASQEHSVPADQISHSIDSCACCPYYCQSFVAPCPASACSYGGALVGQNFHAAPSSVPGDSHPLKDCDMTRTAMEAARKAISSLKIAGSSISEGKEKREEGQVVGTSSSETDLTDVLNAWYSAGFFTGKYLVEKSIGEERQS